MRVVHKIYYIFVFRDSFTSMTAISCLHGISFPTVVPHELQKRTKGFTYALGALMHV